MHDLVIRGGNVVDGSGAAPRTADIAIDGEIIVELEGGARMPTNIVDVEADPEHVKIGMALQVTFDDLDDKISLPKFRPA